MATRSTAPVLSRRTLNRTLLGRQFLLERVQLPPEVIIERLVGLQAQEPGDPYVALWSRIEGFDPSTLSTLIAERRAVRMGHLRGTLHLVSARDAQAHHPIFLDVMARTWRSSPFAKRLVGEDIDAVVRAARQALEERPQTPSQLAAILARPGPTATRHHWPMPPASCCRSSRCRHADCGAGRVARRTPRWRRGSANRSAADRRWTT